MKSQFFQASQRMNTLTLSLSAACLIGLLTSCGDTSNHDYDTAEGLPMPASQTSSAENVTYGQAVYEENAHPTAPQAIVNPPTAPEAALAIPAAQQDIGNTAATPRFHYVAPGDSLWKISKQYKIPVASIKAANNMTNDIVVLGKKMIIPAH